MDKNSVYSKLETKMLKYKELVSVPVKAVQESLLPIPTDNLVVSPIDPNMFSYTGDNIYVRESLIEKLLYASTSINNVYPGCRLEIVYGYRALSIQKRLFNTFLSQFKNSFEKNEELLEKIHTMIAVPDVAGHPTGGAVDVQIIDKSGKPLDLGTSIWEFVQDSYTFSPFISKTAKVNRKILRDVMSSAGFAPYDGEWWHFSYGDKEWAKYYNQPYAIYDQVEFKIKKEI